jgi:hypothetical protein
MQPTPATSPPTAEASVPVLRYQLYVPWAYRHSAGSVMNNASSPTRK